MILDKELHTIAGEYNVDTSKPDFDQAEKIHDWRNYVPQVLQENWNKLCERERLIIIIMAGKQAHNEEWD